MSTSATRIHGNWEYANIDGVEKKRRVGTTKWELTDVSLPDEILHLELYIVRQVQADGEPYHWSLFVANEGKAGAQYQVKGDTTMMHYMHAKPVNMFLSESFFDSFTMARLTEAQAARVHHWATQETPPSAPNLAAVTENCQGWVVRVVKRLVEEGIVEPKWVLESEKMKQPVK